MASVFVIAECGSSWRFGTDHLSNAYRMIEAAKDAGADACKFQYCSDGRALAKRRRYASVNAMFNKSGGSVRMEVTDGIKMRPEDVAEGEMYQRYLQYDPAWLKLFKAKCDEVGIEFMCTVFIPADVAVIAPLVRRWKIAAKEAGYEDLLRAIWKYIVPKGEEEHTDNYTQPLYISRSKDSNGFFGVASTWLVCTSEYPCPIEHMELRRIYPLGSAGLSDHTGHVLTSAVAVGAGARVLEVHFRLDDTPDSNPDAAGHSHTPSGLKQYIENARIAERML